MNDWNGSLVFFRNKKILVTGNTGFKGTWLTTWLTKLGSNVQGLSLGIPTEVSLFSDVGTEIEGLTNWMDICQTSDVRSIIQSLQPDVIFHLAAQSIVSKSFDDPLETWRTNTLGTVSLLEAVRLSSLKNCSIVMVTSDKVYLNHEWPWGYRETDELGGYDPYSASKAGAELAIRSYVSSGNFHERDIRIASVRAGNVIGGGDWAPGRVVPDAVRSWISRQSMTLRHPSSTRPWQHVLEPLSGYLLTAASLHKRKIESGQSLNFGPSDVTSQTALDLIRLLDNLLGGETRLKIKQGVGSKNESGLLRLSSEKALHLLGWRSRLSFEETVNWTADWYGRHNRGESALELCVEQIEKYQSLLNTSR